jgi:DNA-binding XRE family transcriptional regulator
MKKWNDLKKELLQDPAVKREYIRSKPHYEVARALLKARLNKRLTQAELAKKAGVSQVIIARLESGTSNPTLNTIQKVADVLGKKIRLVGSR